MLGNVEYQRIISEVEQGKDGVFKPYYEKVRRAYAGRIAEDTETFTEEVIAHIAEDARALQLPLMQRIIRLITEWFNTVIGKPTKLTDIEVASLVRGSLQESMRGGLPKHMLMDTGDTVYGQIVVAFPEWGRGPVRSLTRRHFQYFIASLRGKVLPSEEERRLRSNMDGMMRVAQNVGKKGYKNIDVHLPVVSEETNVTSRYAVFKNIETGTELVVRVSNHPKTMYEAVSSYPFISWNEAHKNESLDFSEIDTAVKLLSQGKMEGMNAAEAFLTHRLGDPFGGITPAFGRKGTYQDLKRGIKDKAKLQRIEFLETQERNSSAVINDDSAMYSIAPEEELPDGGEFLRRTSGGRRRSVADSVQEFTLASRLKTRWAQWVQGAVDAYRPIKNRLGDDGERAWQMMQLSENSHGLLNAVLNFGRPKEVYTEAGEFDWYSVDVQGEGFLDILRDLNGESDRFFSWLIANRSQDITRKWQAAERTYQKAIADRSAGTISKEDLATAKKIFEDTPKERNFTEEEVASGLKYNEGKMADGRMRSKVYLQSMLKVSAFQKSMLDIAESAGIINKETRELLATDFYIPMYRQFEFDGEAAVKGPTPQHDFVNIKDVIHKMRGSELDMNDALDNLLMNWVALMRGSMKNRAGIEAMKAAVSAGVARRLDSKEAAQVRFAKKSGDKKATEEYVYVLENGERVVYEITDALVMNSFIHLGWGGIDSKAIRAMSNVKRIFTLGVTASPAFKIRNLLRDTVHSIAVGQMNYNMFGNVKKGMAAMAEGSVIRAEMMAGGGAFSFGFLNEDPGAIRRLINTGLAGKEGSRILTTPRMARDFMRDKVWGSYQELGNKLENANRAALYMKRRDEVGHLQASFEARDLLNFSSHGKHWAAQALIAFSPFLNARLQGLDKMGRSTLDRRTSARMLAVTGLVVFASVAYMLSMEDDDEYQNLEEWIRDTYWPIKVGNKWYFLPKPFEIGAVASVVERITKNFIDDSVDAKYTAERIKDIIQEQLAFDLRPQALRPWMEVGNNKDSFLNRHIESPFDRRPKAERKRAFTSEFSVVMSEALGATLRPIGGEDKDYHLSPIQIDHLIRGYFGWAGTTIVAAFDKLVTENIRDMPEKPTKRMDEIDWIGPIPFPIKSFIRESPIKNTKQVDLFYRQMQEIDKYRAAYVHYRDLGMTEKAIEIMQEHMDVLKYRKTYNKIQRRISAIGKQIRRIQASRVLTPDQKRSQIDSLTQRKLAIIGVAVKLRGQVDDQNEPVNWNLFQNVPIPDFLKRK